MNKETNTDIFIKIYRSFLSSGGILEIDQIILPFIQMDPLLHKKAASDEIDVGAFLYSFLRLPNELKDASEIVVGQTEEIFEKGGYDIKNYKLVTAAARRRKTYFGEDSKLCFFINSVTDVDDLICLLTSYQIEWNKIHKILNEIDSNAFQNIINSDNFSDLDKIFKTQEISFFDKFSKVWKNEFKNWIQKIHSQSMSFKIKQLRGSYVDYQRATSSWYRNIKKNVAELNEHSGPIYFVSSNTHSIVNTITGFVNKIETELIDFIHKKNLTDLIEYWEDINKGNLPGSKENFLWYILKKFEDENPHIREERINYEKSLGIVFIESNHALDINAQVIKVSKLSESHLGEKISKDLSTLKDSNAMIINIDYPLGSGAYMVLSTILRHTNDIKGVYILGKASFLNGKLGDIGLPTQVYDDHSKNTFIFSNCFNKNYFKEFETGSVLENQYSISTKGTLLHPEESLMSHFQEGYTLLEMENGGYLSSVYETTNYKRYTENETINLVNLPFDLGIIHYASDTPFTKAITLGTRNLGYEGVEPTYASSLAILQRIIEMESKY